MTKVLLVGDDADQVDGLKSSLGRRNPDWEITCAVNGKEAKKLIAEARPGFDLVITDGDMPEMSGTELLKWTRAWKPDLPVFFLMGRDMNFPDAYLTKPAKSGKIDAIAKALLVSH